MTLRHSGDSGYWIHCRGWSARIRLHDVRHTYATIALGSGVDVKIVSERLGHASMN